MGQSNAKEVARLWRQRQNISTARAAALLARDFSVGRSHRVGLMAELVSGLQAGVIDAEPVPDRTASPASSSPVESVLALFQKSQVRLDESKLKQLYVLNRLKGDARKAFTDLVVAFDVFRRSAMAAYPKALPLWTEGVLGINEASGASGRPFDVRGTPAREGPGVSSGDAGFALISVLAARDGLIEAAVSFGEAVRHSRDDVPRVQLEMAPVLCLDLEGVDSVHDADCMLSIDVGGNDRYNNNAGGNGWTIPKCNFLTIARAAALVDLDGDDRYLSPDGCGSNGGGYYGFGFLFDESGNDMYGAGSSAVNGGALGGAGLLVDVDGDDRYEAGSDAANGGGAMGYGFLIDGNGDDVYHADAGYALNGGAFQGGGGALVDLGGADNYVANLGCAGANGGGSVADGFLLDLASEGASQVLSTGACIHGQNGGAVVGTGFLYSEGANNRYASGSEGANGGGNVGLLIDSGGDDSYTAFSVPDFSDPREENGSRGGLLLDVGGHDYYSDDLTGASNGTGWDKTVCPLKDIAGCQMDVAT